MCKSVFAVAVATVAFSGSALAADLPSRKAPLIVPILHQTPKWTGFYAGLNAGATFGNRDSIASNALSLRDDAAPAMAGFAGAVSATGWGKSDAVNFIGGGQIGFNQQFSRFLIGTEADFQGLAGSRRAQGFTGLAADPLASGVGSMATLGGFQKSLDFFGTVRGRLGYLVLPNLLAYATGGLAYGQTNLSASYFTGDLRGVYGASAGRTSFSDTRIGWTAGGGLEYLVNANWSAKVEYLYYDLGSVTTTPVVLAGLNGPALGWAAAASSRTRFDGHVVRLGVNYHFNWGSAPIVARF